MSFMFHRSGDAMTLLRYIFVLQFAATSAFAQLQPEAATHKRPEGVVRSLYREIVARHPVGIPHGEDRERISSYLSKHLLGRFDTAQACERDYVRQNKDPDLKPPFDWLEMGVFSGANEEALPASFHIDRTQPSKDGTFRVYLRLTYGHPTSLTWHVVANVVSEDTRFVVDDVVLLKDATGDGELAVSQILKHGCEGPRWVGNGEEKGGAR